MNHTAREIKSSGHFLDIVIAYTIAAFLCPAIYYWCNHVLHWHQLGYWPWFFINLGWMFAAASIKPLRQLSTIFIVSAVFAQCLSWAGVVVLPLFKL